MNIVVTNEKIADCLKLSNCSLLKELCRDFGIPKSGSRKNELIDSIRRFYVVAPPDIRKAISIKLQPYALILEPHVAYENWSCNIPRYSFISAQSFLNYNENNARVSSFRPYVKQVNSNEMPNTNNQFFLKDRFCIICGVKRGNDKVKCFNCNRVFHRHCLYSQEFNPPENWKCFECCHKNISIYEEKSLSKVISKYEIKQDQINRYFFFDPYNINNNPSKYHTDYFVSVYSVVEGDLSRASRVSIRINDRYDIQIDDGEKNVTRLINENRICIKITDIIVQVPLQRIGLFLLVYSVNNYRNSNINTLGDEMLINSLNLFPTVYSLSLIKDTLCLIDDDSENNNNNNNKENSNNDDDVIVSDENLELTLCDPVSLGRITIPVRSVECCHIQCFDLKTFLMISSNNQKMLKCPICNMKCDNMKLMIDSLVYAILRETNEDKVEMKSNGSWNVKKEEMKEEMKVEKKEEVVDITDDDDDDKENENNEIRNNNINNNMNIVKNERESLFKDFPVNNVISINGIEVVDID